MDKIKYMTSLTQCLKSHLIHFRNIEGSHMNVENVSIDKYLKLSSKLLSCTLPKKDLESRVLQSFLNEIVAGTILPVIVNKIANPHFLNTIIASALSASDHTPKKNKDLSLSDILDQGFGLLEFIKYCKEQNAYSMVRFYNAVVSFKKIYDFMGEKGTRGAFHGDGNSHQSLSLSAMEIYNFFFSEDSNARIHLHGSGKLLKKTLRNIQLCPDSKVFDPVLKYIFSLLEDRYLPVFRKSKAYKDICNLHSPGLRRKTGCRNLEIVKLTL